MKKRFTNEQIVAVLQRHENGEKAKDLCREIGVSGPSFYAWKTKFGGMNISDIRKMKDLEIENARLKRMIANQAIDIEILKEVNSRKW